jgi:uncharacterized cupredoxin-like copper-binding protein
MRFLAAVLVVSCAACSPGTRQERANDQSLFESAPDSRFALTMRDLRFEPGGIAVDRAALFSLELTNEGEVLHDFSIDRLEAPVGFRPYNGASEGDGSRRAVHVTLRPGERAEVRMRIDAPAEYSFFCDQPGHRRGGMSGTITVR